ncbi:MAG: hypothetical protein PWQ10_196 [Patescibacteria group bacterium]|nr:hypothetical protein [Patescibacteria group bacterium]
MPDKSHSKYTSNLRGNQDIFLVDIMRSSEFRDIKEKHLKDIFIGIFGLLRRVDEHDESGQKVLACADEISDVFKISKDNAVQLLIAPQAPAAYHMQYIPQIKRDGDDIVLRIGQKTTQADIKEVWRHIKSLQRDIGGSGVKSSINPELAFSIHRQYVLKKRKMKDVFDDYRHNTLEGYEHSPTIEDEDEFRKRYKRVVKGL